MIFFHKRLTNVVEWQPGDQDILVYRDPHHNLHTYTQLIVQESQEAVLFKDGEMIAKFGPGRHTLDTRNIPVLSEQFGVPFDGKNPFTADVWFVNMLDFKGIRFKTDMFRYHDPDYRTMVPLIGSGRYGLRIVDSVKFLRKVVGTRESFSHSDLTTFLQGDISSAVTSCISGHMQADSIGIKAISGYLTKLSNLMTEEFKTLYNEFGIELISFLINAVDIDDSREDGQQVLEAMAMQSAQSIAGYNWQQKQTFDIAQEQIKVAGEALKSKTEFGILGAMMMATGHGTLTGGIGATVQAANAGSATSSVLFESKSSGQISHSDLDSMVLCSNCGRKYPKTSKFCPFCGDVYNPCPQCGYDNHINAVKCTRCGACLQDASGGICPQCGHPIVTGSDFCSQCGKEIAQVCSRCKTKLKAGATFCHVCGKKK